MVVCLLVAILILASAVWVVTLRNVFRAALSLGLVLVGVAAAFVLLEAEFLAFVQILVYVGAILALVIFAIMLTSRRQLLRGEAAARQQGPAAAVALGLFALLCAATSSLTSGHPPVDAVTLPALGQGLVTTLVLPFEVVSLVLVGAMVGAVAIAAPRSKGGLR